MILFYLPYYWLIRLSVMAFSVAAFSMSFYFCYQIMVLPAALKHRRQAQVVLPDQSPSFLATKNNQVLFTRCAVRAGCAIKKTTGTQVVIEGSAAGIARCAWLCDLHGVAISVFVLRPRNRVRLFEWRVAV